MVDCIPQKEDPKDQYLVLLSHALAYLKCIDLSYNTEATQLRSYASRRYYDLSDRIKEIDSQCQADG